MPCALKSNPEVRMDDNRAKRVAEFNEKYIQSGRTGRGRREQSVCSASTIALAYVVVSGLTEDLGRAMFKAGSALVVAPHSLP
jgi:hypothetical protein